MFQKILVPENQIPFTCCHCQILFCTHNNSNECNDLNCEKCTNKPPKSCLLHSIEEHDTELVTKILQQLFSLSNDYTISSTANLLNIPRTTLLKIAKEYNIPIETILYKENNNE